MLFPIGKGRIQVLKMDKITQNKFKRTAVVSSLVPGVLGGLFLFLAVRKDFDSGIGHFAEGSVLFGCFAACLAAAVIAAAVTAVLAGKRRYLPAEGETAGILRIFPAYSAALIAAVLFGTGVWDRLRLESSSLPGLIELILLPGIAVYFVLAVSQNGRCGKARAAAGIASCLSVNFMLFSGYFDFTLPLNSPVRNALTIMEAALLLFFLSETRTVLGKNTPAFSCFASCTAISLTGGIGTGLFLVVMFAADRVPAGLSVLRAALCILAAAYAAFTFLTGHASEAVPETDKNISKR